MLSQQQTSLKALFYNSKILRLMILGKMVGGYECFLSWGGWTQTKSDRDGGYVALNEQYYHIVPFIFGLGATVSGVWLSALGLSAWGWECHSQWYSGLCNAGDRTWRFPMQILALVYWALYLAPIKLSLWKRDGSRWLEGKCSLSTPGEPHQEQIRNWTQGPGR